MHLKTSIRKKLTFFQLISLFEIQSLYTCTQFFHSILFFTETVNCFLSFAHLHLYLSDTQNNSILLYSKFIKHYLNQNKIPSNLSTIRLKGKLMAKLI